VQKSLCASLHFDAEGRQHWWLLAPIEEVTPKGPLQPLQLPADRGLGQWQAARNTLYRAFLGENQESAQFGKHAAPT
jgi:hypothetical protein